LINGQQVTELPLNGRNYMQLVLSVPAWLPEKDSAPRARVEGRIGLVDQWRRGRREPVAGGRRSQQ